MFNELVVLIVAILSTAFRNEEARPSEGMGWAIIIMIVMQAMVNFVINIVINGKKWVSWVKMQCLSRYST
jgi:hypothetical protein